MEALGRLAINGLVEGFQNRFPLTWSDRTAKIAKITGWTVSADHPKGSRRMAAAILDFWTSDWASLAVRLREGAPGLDPELFERPFLKMGPFLFQLPWVVASQNNSTAAINNLRRLGARRTEAGLETGRIERRLHHQFEERGFRVVLNYRPPILGPEDPGEVDVISARDGIVLVLELKSTFLRRSQREAWLHGTTTLRKAGLQLRRKVEAVRDAVAADEALISALAIDSTAGAPVIHGWIVDTSIECDHQRFFGFLKVSLEEVLIALRDDRELLDDPAGSLDPRVRPSEQGDRPGDETAVTLYPEGFTAARFIEVIESEAVWHEAATDDIPPRTGVDGQQA